MDLSVQIHADNISGARRAIVLTKTARNKVRLDLEPPIALGLVRSIDFKNVRADPTSMPEGSNRSRSAKGYRVG